MKNIVDMARYYLIPTAVALTMTVIFATPFIGILSWGLDNPVVRAHRHITENQENIGKLVASAAQEQERITMDPRQEPFLHNDLVHPRHTQPGTETIIGYLEYRMDPPGSSYLVAEYLVTYRELGGPLRHSIPGENYRLEDSFLDAASIQIVNPRIPLRTETAAERQPLRITMARKDQ